MNTLATEDFRLIDEQDIVVISTAVIGCIQGLGAAIDRVIRTWVRRSNERRALARLNNGMLTDIGLNRADIDREARKYFWQK